MAKWIEHTSGICPVQPNDYIRVELSNGNIQNAFPGKWYWGTDAHILLKRYKVLWRSSSKKWTAWIDGDCPVDGDALVKVVMRGGEPATMLAKHVQWRIDNDDHGVIAYKMVKKSKWIKHTTNTCPVNPQWRVRVKLVDGSKLTGAACAFTWMNDPGLSGSSRIAAYKVILTFDFDA